MPSDSTLKDAAREMVRTSEDRRLVTIVVGEVTLQLAPEPTLTEAKAQWADALWAVEQLLLKGRESR